MVTFKQVSKGSAYKYYRREVVVGDGRRPRGKSLEEAQEEAGVPPGVWMGRALLAVGLVAGARVTEGQMRNLFGEGLHPDADRIVAGRLVAGDSPAAAARAARLGYRVQEWSGNDLVFRPPGSVQVLWALGSPPVRQLVEDIHTRIIGEVLASAETEHLWVRVGGDSTVQRARAGVIAARFRHYENRDGMPLLHDHVVLSVKVRRQDDRWGTLHTRSFLEYAVALSELYNQRRGARWVRLSWSDPGSQARIQGAPSTGTFSVASTGSAYPFRIDSVVGGGVLSPGGGVGGIRSRVDGLPH
ncbi:MobF family relaxase [Streptomyces sp. NPDC055681]